jgi:predicted DNA binding CopG/RHH family protein
MPHKNREMIYMAKEKPSHIDSVTREILKRGKDVIKDFDDSQEVYVVPKKLESKLISIRLPMAVIANLRKIATARGDIGYQQIIKTYIAEGLIRDNQTIQCNIPQHQIFLGTNIYSVSSSYCEVPSNDPLTGASWALNQRSLIWK